MPYLTPQEIPEGEDCRPLFIPANSEWLALFGGALTELTLNWNWEYSGGLTIDQTIAKMTEIIEAWYDGNCEFCETPDGYRVIRINEQGHVEQLEGDAWVEPTGDYYIPPPAAREEPTEDERRCLAAANAVNVLKTLYESLSDSYNEDLDHNQAMLALIGVFVGAVGFAIAPISWGIYAFVAWIFSIMFALLEFVTADLWDEDVSNQIECFLYECSNDDAGVITFDYECFQAKLNELANGFGLSEAQIRLYLQITYLLNFIGGVDGLNLTGATTAIESADCSDCVICETYDDDMPEGIGPKTRIVQVDTSNQTFWVYPTGSPDGVWTDTPLSGVAAYIKAIAGSPHANLVSAVLIELGTDCLIDGWSFDYFKWGGTATCDIYVQWGAYDDAGAYITGGGGCRGGGSFGWYPEYYLSFNTVARYLYFKVYGYTGGVDFGISNLHVQITS